MASATAPGGSRPSSTSRRSAGGERFEDFVLCISVLLFILLGTGIGILSLQASVR
ncbi:MAG: hypothetical protein ABJB98_08820 [Actinomycetota bacterium]